MSKNAKVLVLDTTDIIMTAGKKSLVDLNQSDLRPKSFQAFTISDMVVGITESGQTVILKNRWGIQGVVVSHKDYNKFVKPNYDEVKIGSIPKKKTFLERLRSIKIYPFN